MKPPRKRTLSLQAMLKVAEANPNSSFNLISAYG
jgi:hypothetical protein